MAQTTISVRMDENLKKDFDHICNELGMTMTTAITMLAKKMTREQRLPFEPSMDPFFSERNMARLKAAIQDVESGKSTLKEHDLIEEDSDEKNLAG